MWNHRCTAVPLSETCKTLSQVWLSPQLRVALFTRACTLLCRLYCQRRCLEESPHLSRVIGTRIYSDVSHFSVGCHRFLCRYNSNICYFSLYLCRSQVYAERRSTPGWFGMKRAATLTWCQWTWRNITRPRIKTAFSQRGRRQLCKVVTLELGADIKRKQRCHQWR